MYHHQQHHHGLLDFGSHPAEIWLAALPSFAQTLSKLGRLNTAVVFVASVYELQELRQSP